MTLAQPQKNYEKFAEEVINGHPSELRLQQIVSQLKKDKEAMPHEDGIREMLGIALLRLKRFDKATSELRTAFNIAPCKEYASNLLLSYREAGKYDEGSEFNLKNIEYLPDSLITSIILGGTYSDEVIELLGDADVPVIRAAIESGLCKELTSIFRFLIENTNYGSSYSFEAEKEEGDWIIDILVSIVGDEQDAIECSRSISRELRKQYNSKVLMRIVPLVNCHKAA
ncbi:MAG: hypothetical protein K9M17_02785 [Mariprofundaceae bacterium]|nr:hypothetical protein [Mariprofundaceae bacterium]